MTDLDVIAQAFKTVHESVMKLSQDGLENDRALLKLCETLAQSLNDTTNKLVELEVRNQVLENQVVNLDNAVTSLNNKIEMLHELYHTHFNDDVTRH